MLIYPLINGLFKLWDKLSEETKLAVKIGEFSLAIILMAIGGVYYLITEDEFLTFDVEDNWHLAVDICTTVGWFGLWWWCYWFIFPTCEAVYVIASFLIWGYSANIFW